MYSCTTYTWRILGNSLSSTSSIGIVVRWREMAKSHFLGTLMYPMLVAPLPSPPPLRRFTEIVVLQTTNIEYNPKSTNTFYIFLYLSSFLFIFRHLVFPRLFFLILRSFRSKSNPSLVIPCSVAHFSYKHA